MFDAATTSDFNFGTSTLNRAARQLLLDGKPAKLGARAFDVLLALIERRDRVVSKNELLDVVWRGLVVEENNLQVHIWTLRKLLGPQAISTVPGRGYRFTVALASDVDSAIPPAIAAAPSSASISESGGTQVTLFGREHDLIALPQAVMSHRLVTIVGSGGIGKTALAKATAAVMKPAFIDGVWLVDLAPLDDSAQLAPVVAAH